MSKTTYTGAPRRDSRFELLRILAMLSIVLCHVVANNGWMLEQRPGKTGIMALAVDQFMGQFGVALFFMLSGFFMIGRTRMGWWHIGKVMIQTFTYSIICLLSAMVLFHVDVTPKDIYRSVFPVLNDTYWFVTAYVLMLLAAPFINGMFERTGQATQSRFIVALLLLGIVPYISFMGFAYNGLQWTTSMYAICCYAIGGYIRRYRESIWPKFNMFRLLVIGVIGFVALTVFLWAAIRQISIASFFQWQPRSLYGSLPVFSIITAAGALLLVAKSYGSAGNGIADRIINTVASLTFGIYLIHQHPVLLPPLWGMIGHIVQYPGNPLAGLAVLLVESVVLFAVLGVLAWIIDHIIIHPLQHAVHIGCQRLGML